MNLTSCLVCFVISLKISSNLNVNDIFAVLMQVILQGDRTVIGARPLLTVEPLLQALRDVRYVYLEELRLWNIVMPYEMIASVVCIYEQTVRPYSSVT